MSDQATETRSPVPGQASEEARNPHLKHQRPDPPIDPYTVAAVVKFVEGIQPCGPVNVTPELIAFAIEKRFAERSSSSPDKDGPDAS